MSLISANLLAELKKPNPAAVFLLELGLPGGTKRYGSIPFASASQGLYEARVLNWGQITRTWSVGLQSHEFSVVIDDSDFTFAKIIEGSSGNSVRNATAIARIACPTLAAADWFECFNGVIAGWAMTAPCQYTLRLRQKDAALFQYVPRVALTTADFQNIHPDAVGQYAPLLYGNVTSFGGTGTGAVPLPYVDTLNYRYLVCLNAAKSVDRVFVDGVDTGGAGWTTVRTMLNGNYYTLVDFTANQGSAVITADVQGYETVGDASGTIITNPAKILEHFLANFVFSDVRDSVWISPSTVQINTTYITACADFFTNMGVQAARRIADQAQAQDILNDWCKAWEIPVLWTSTGKIGVLQEDHRITAVYPEDPWIKADEDCSNFTLDFEETDLTSRVTCRAGYDPAGNAYRRSLESRDALSGEDLTYTIDNPWTSEVAQAQAVNRLTGGRRLFLYRRPRTVINLTGPLWYAGTELSTDCTVSHWAYPEATGAGAGRQKWKRKFFRTHSVSIDPNTGTVQMVLKDARPYQTLLREIDVLRKTGTADEDGNARMDMGTNATRTLTRATVAYVEDPSSRLIVQVASGAKKFDYLGLLLERERANGLLRSSFATWTGAIPDGWGVGGYANGSSLAEAAGVTIFDSTITSSSVLMTAGNPHTVENVFAQTSTTSYSANDAVMVSVDHKDDGGEAAYVRILRMVDGWFWNGSSFQAGSINLAMSVSASARTRDTFFIPDIGGSASTIRVNVLQPTGGTVSRTNRVYHVQVEKAGTSASPAPWASSRIVTTSATVTRNKDVYTVANNTGYRCWNNTRGTIMARIIPLWTGHASATLGTDQNHTIFYVGYDANNSEWLYYDGANAAFKFTRRVGGVTTTATLSSAVTPGTVLRLAARWTSSEGELGLSSFTHQVVHISTANVVSTASAVSSASPTEVNTVNLEIGSKSGADELDGYISYIDSSPFVLTDEEIARRMPT